MDDGTSELIKYCTGIAVLCFFSGLFSKRAGKIVCWIISVISFLIGCLLFFVGGLPAFSQTAVPFIATTWTAFLLSQLVRPRLARSN